MKINLRMLDPIFNDLRYSEEEINKRGHNYNDTINNVIFYNIGVYGIDTLGTSKISLLDYEETYLKVSFDDNFDFINKEIVLACFGCNVLRFINKKVSLGYPL